MSKIRQLNETEKRLNSNAIKRMQERNKALDFYVRKTELDLNEGLEVSFKQTKADYEKALSEFKSELKNNSDQIKILTEQNEKGVEEKNTKEYTG